MLSLQYQPAPIVVKRRMCLLQLLAMLVVRADMEEDLVYNITKSLFENLETIEMPMKKEKKFR